MKRFLVLFLSVCIIGTMCGCASTSKPDSSQATTGQTAYAIGDEIIIKNDSGEYKLTITGVEETDDRNEFADSTPERVIIISYAYENISHNSDLYISEMNFKAYDKDNNAMDTYPLSTVEYPDSISTGRKTSAQLAYGLNSSDNYVELEFYDNMFLDSDCKIALEW